MSLLTDDGTELFELLSRFVRERYDDTPLRLAEQDDELKKRECTAPSLGKWVEGSSDFPFLIETLMLSDAVFREEFPGVKLAAEERRQFANALEGHCETCPRCGLQRAYSLEWQWRVDKAIAENREAIGRAIANTAGKK